MNDLNRWPLGTRVIVRNPNSWADGLTGEVTSNGRHQVEVKLDGDAGYYRAHAGELRTHS
jgi:hypothetical protein